MKIMIVRQFSPELVFLFVKVQAPTYSMVELQNDGNSNMVVSRDCSGFRNHYRKSWNIT